jgi:lysophospholipase L1-like esterase
MVRRIFLASAVFLALAMLLSLAALPAEAQQYQTWFLAEGAQNAFFDEEILIANPNAGLVRVRITYFPQIGTPPPPQEFEMAGTSRTTVRLRNVAGLPQSPISARVESLTPGGPIVVERGMYWLGRLAGHSAAGVTALAPKWHLGEGATGVFDDFVLVANPNETPATVRLTFLPDPATGMAPVTWTDQVVPARGRSTYRINDIPAVQNSFGSFGFSTVVESVSGQPIAVERAMYWGGLRGGHNALGVTQPSPTWYFGEGATSGNAALQFYTFFLLQNPSTTQTATVTLTAFLDGVSTPVTRAITLPPSSRRTVYANSPSADIGFPSLPSSGIGFATTVTSDVPIIAERAIYFGVPGQPWADGHATAGATSLASAWAFADGVEGPSPGDPAGLAYTTFFLVANPTDAPLPLEITFMREDGTGIVVQETAPARSRHNVLPSRYPELIGQRFATVIRATNGARFVAERSVYWRNASGGHTNLGIPWEGQPLAPPPAPPPAVWSITPNQGRLSGGTPITITGVAFRPGATVTINGQPATNVAFVNSQTLTARTPANPTRRTGPAELRVTNTDGKVGAGGFVYTFRVLAFGDSITAGATSFLDGDVIRGAWANPYSQRLAQWLRTNPNFSTGQTFVRGAGVPYECVASPACPNTTSSGSSRLPAMLSGDDYELLVLFQGVNDLIQQRSVAATAGTLQGMVATAQGRGVRVIITHLTPAITDVTGFYHGPPAGTIDGLNAAINGMAPRVSWSGFPLSFLSADGLHPTQEGYDYIADQIYTKVRSEYALP